MVDSELFRLIQDLKDYFIEVKLLENTALMLYTELDACYDEETQEEIIDTAVEMATEEYMNRYGGE